MLHQFYPDYEADSAYGIDYRTLYEQGYRGIIFDIDNTLVPHGAPATPQATEFFGRLRELGFQTLLLSNNKEPRVKSFADAVGASYIYKAGKPGGAHPVSGDPQYPVHGGYHTFCGGSAVHRCVGS